MRNQPGAILRAVLRNRGAAIFLVLQVAVGMAVVVNMLAIALQFRHFVVQPTGYGEREVFLVTVESVTGRPPAIPTEALFSQVPGVRSVASITHMPISWAQPHDVLRPEGFPKGVLAWPLEGSAALPSVLGLALVDGTGFSTALPENKPAPVLVTQALAAELSRVSHRTSAVGMTLRSESRRGPFVVTGVVKDVLVPSSYAPGANFGVFYLRSGSGWRRKLFLVRVDPTVADRFDTLLHDTLSRQDHGVRYVATSRSIETHKLLVNRNGAGAAKILAFGCSVVIAVILLGSLGISSFVVVERMREIGVRRALGARRRDIVRYFLLENWLSTSMGLLLGVLLSYALLLLTHHFNHTIKLTPPVFLSALCMFWLTGLLAALVPAVRGAKIPPTVASKGV